MQHRIIQLVASLALLALLAGPAFAQGTLSELGAVNSARNEMIRGDDNPQQNNNRQADQAEEPPADEGEDEGEAAAAAAVVDKDKWNDEHSIRRRTAPAVSWLKLLVVVMVFGAWVRSADWINRDAQAYDLNHGVWNAAAVGPFAIGSLLLLILPAFAAGFSIYTLAWLAPLIAYSVFRNKQVERHERVFTPGWFRFQLAMLGKKVGLNMGAEKMADYEKGPPVDLKARGGPDTRTNDANLLTARQSPGFVHVKELVADIATRRGDRAVLDYGAEAVGMRYYIDGVWVDGEPRDREMGDIMLAVMKQLANLNPTERRKKQSGEFGADFQGQKYTVKIKSQGAKSGERVVVSLTGAKKPLATYEQLGMREKLRDQVIDIMASDAGLVVFSAMPDGGLTTLTDIALLETDRLMRDFVMIEPQGAEDREFENIEPCRYNPAAGETPATLMPRLIRKYPNVYVCRDFVDAESAKALLGESLDGKLVVTTTYAKEAPEALLRLLQKKAPHKELAQSAIASINTRLIRTLCDECKVGYEPSPELLRKLGIPAGKVETLYNPPKPEEVDKPCKKCQGIGYHGRTGLFEVLLLDDQVRQVLLKQPKVDALRKASRAAGMRTLQEEGVLLVAKGSTSLAELSRVLKL
ncbi:Type II secretion system protein E [Pseudobythopirellula maris]|uniref:Type II secretion system protein E n=1 Tax=Pseudobythopirellula maris TaxID=2527991 RepID=A0A5C5ZL68_9BACT|nr:ATPase, T2SS/T4P/T4SS family [Pseudobythopirellula maris]TWT87551.1 Type II secretion system protein E [Pseudobythopirellula maris]